MMIMRPVSPVIKWLCRETLTLAMIIGGLPLIVLVLSQAPALPAESCIASWYGAESGRRTASGEPFNPRGMTAAHRSAPFGSIMGVRAYGREIRVRINDRGPFVKGRCIDLAEGAAEALGIKPRGSALVQIERIAVQ